jgi:ribulose-5-phosphate 4-epimerase/fuculose-1-phosphate aldolase
MDASVWLETRDRLRARRLLDGEGHLSLRWPGGEAMWRGRGGDAAPVVAPISASREAPIDAAIYAARADVGAIVAVSSPYAQTLAALGGRLPILFDEQARHLGAIVGPCARPDDLRSALKSGANVALIAGTPLALGTTPQRLALNAELFEKCAKAYALAFAAGGPTPSLPAWVRWIANRRLLKDERRARARFAEGLTPEDNNRY